MDFNKVTFKAAFDLFNSAYPGSPFYIALMYLARNSMLRITRHTSRESLISVDQELGTNELLIAILDEYFVDTLNAPDLMEDWELNGIVGETLTAKIPDTETYVAVSQLFDINNEKYSYNPAYIFDAANNLMSIDYSTDENQNLYLSEFEIAVSRTFRYTEIPYEPALFALMGKLASLEEGDNICLPSDRAGLLLPLLGKSKIGVHMTMETNPVYRAVALLKANNLCINKNCITPYDSLDEWPSYKAREFNKILCIPPFGVPVPSKKSKNKTFMSENCILHNAISYLHEGGVFVGLFPRRALSTNFVFGSEIKYLHTVITLPAKSTISRDNLVMLVFKKKANISSGVLLVDATMEYSPLNDNFNRFEYSNLDNVLSLIDSYKEDTINCYGENSAYVSRVLLERNNYLLNPRLYIDAANILVKEGFAHGDGFVTVALSDITTTCQYEEKTKEKGVVCRSLLELSQESKTKPRIRNLTDTLILDSSCLVFPGGKQATNDIKVKYFESFPEIMHTNPRFLFALKVKPEIGRYLEEEFHKPYVKAQITNIQFCNAARILREGDLKLIQVIVPNDPSSFDMLSAKSAIERTSQESELLKQAYAESARKEHDEYVKNIHMRKHAIGQILDDLCPAFDMVNDCRIEHNGQLNDDMVVSYRSGQTVKDYFIRIKAALDRIEDMVDSFTDEIRYGEAVDIDIRQFIKEYSEKHFSENYDIILDLNPIICDYPDFSGELLTSVAFSKNDLTQVFDNILSNAVKYGFVDDKRKDYKIVISVETFNSDVIIRIGNNGNRIPEDFKLEKVFAWKQTTGKGSGLGGYQVKSIVEHFGGTVDIKNYSDDLNGITVEYSIKLKDTSILGSL